MGYSMHLRSDRFWGPAARSYRFWGPAARSYRFWGPLGTIWDLWGPPGDLFYDFYEPLAATLRPILKNTHTTRKRGGTAQTEHGAEQGGKSVTKAETLPSN